MRRAETGSALLVAMAGGAVVSALAAALAASEAARTGCSLMLSRA